MSQEGIQFDENGKLNRGPSARPDELVFQNENLHAPRETAETFGKKLQELHARKMEIQAQISQKNEQLEVVNAGALKKEGPARQLATEIGRHITQDIAMLEEQTKAIDAQISETGENIEAYGGKISDYLGQ